MPNPARVNAAVWTAAGFDSGADCGGGGMAGGVRKKGPRDQRGPTDRESNMSVAQRAIVINHPAHRPVLHPNLDATGLRLHMADESIPPDPREQRVQVPIIDKLKALDATERERQRALEAMPDEDSRDRLRARFDQDDTAKRLRAVQDCAEVIALHLFGCRSELLPVVQREKLLYATTRLLDAVEVR